MRKSLICGVFNKFDLCNVDNRITLSMKCLLKNLVATASPISQIDSVVLGLNRAQLVVLENSTSVAALYCLQALEYAIAKTLSHNLIT